MRCALLSWHPQVKQFDYWAGRSINQRLTVWLQSDRAHRRPVTAHRQCHDTLECPCVPPVARRQSASAVRIRIRIKGFRVIRGREGMGRSRTRALFRPRCQRREAFRCRSFRGSSPCQGAPPLSAARLRATAMQLTSAQVVQRRSTEVILHHSRRMTGPVAAQQRHAEMQLTSRTPASSVGPFAREVDPLESERSASASCLVQ